MHDRKPVLLGVLSLFLLHCSSQAPQAADPDGGDSGPDMAVLMSDPHGPRILSLGTSVKQLTEGESARFVAVVTHPDGLDNLAGGQLTSLDGMIKFGAFQADHQGAYTLDLSWSLLNQTESISFASEEMRSFVAEFYDMKGHKTSQSLALRLHCNGKNACAGACLAQGDQCRGSANLCISGACKPGCFIAGALTNPDSISTDPDHGSCLACKPMSNDHAWTQTATGASCGTNRKCSSGDCGNAFASRTVTGAVYLTDVWGSSASNVYVLGRGFGSDSSLVVTTDGGMSWQPTTGRPPIGYYDSMWGSSANTLYIAGSSGLIAKTVNAGTSWTTLTTGVTASFNQIWGTSSSDVWAVGSGGTVVHSADGGATWQKLSVPSSFASKQMYTVWGSSATDIYIGTEGGYVLRTTNGGTSFTSLKTKQDDSVGNIWGSGKSDVYVVTGSGISRTIDSGATWTDVTPPLAGSFGAIWGSGAGDIYVGSGTQILHSSSSGKSWYRQYYPSGNQIAHLWGTGASDVYAITSLNLSHFP